MLAELVKRYESRTAEGKIPRQGWSKAKISFGLRLKESGEIAELIDLRTEKQSGKKSVLVAQEIEVPEQVKKSSGIVSNFLCENAKYFFGIEENIKRFEEAKRLHLEILENCNSVAAVAVKNFFTNWKPSEIEKFSQIQEYLEDLEKGANILLMFGENYVSEDAEIKMAWENYKQNQSESPLMPCLVTGKILPTARLHPIIKGVRNAQSAGASIVSFNAPAFESYGRTGEQGLNAPVSEYAAFAYGAALNDLLSDSEHVKYFGDATVVYWADENSTECQDCFLGLLEPKEDEISNKDLNEIMKGIQAKNLVFEGKKLNYENPFYILGLSPNSARLSIRFFLEKNFGEVVENIAKHYRDLKITKPSFKKFENIPMWQILAATVSPKSKDKASSPLMSGAVIKSIMTGQNYPVSLFQNAILRVKTEREITYERAAIIKAYLTRNKGRENLMALDENSTDKNYIFGRIFSVLENIQEAANPGLNATIKDKYFNSACATPAHIFPILQKLSVNHLRKLEIGQKIYFEKQLTNLMGKISPTEKKSSTLTLEEQGMFILGYYHQTQERYKSKEEKENG